VPNDGSVDDRLICQVEGFDLAPLWRSGLAMGASSGLAGRPAQQASGFVGLRIGLAHEVSILMALIGAAGR
jgi:hypothetical protein